MIKLENVSLRVPDAHVSSLRQTMAQAFGGKRKWASDVAILDDVSLELDAGARLGLLGRNGAGKSTLLRVMAGVFEATDGIVTRSGKIISLFDLHFGMDEEASGASNLEIAAAMLGVSRADLADIRDEVVGFSELGEALYRPLKTYSSGMRVRLAFSLITALESENLLIDEIIGVGDTAFLEKAQKRILSRIESSNAFVLASHSEAMLRDFCKTGLVMCKGRSVFHGPIEEAIYVYNSEYAGSVVP